MSKRKVSTPEERAEAVRMVDERKHEYSSEAAAIKAVAKDIGWSSSAVSRWVRKAKADQPGQATATLPRLCLIGVIVGVVAFINFICYLLADWLGPSSDAVFLVSVLAGSFGILFVLTTKTGDDNYELASGPGPGIKEVQVPAGPHGIGWKTYYVKER